MIFFFILASKERSDFPIQKIWVLPSHLLVLLVQGSKEELVAYDQVPKLTSNNTEQVNLLQNGTNYLVVSCKRISKSFEA